MGLTDLSSDGVVSTTHFQLHDFDFRSALDDTELCVCVYMGVIIPCPHR